MGDAVLAEFSSTEAAVRSAVALAATFEEASTAAGLPTRLRIGVHVGEITVAQDGDLYGDGVNVASRLQEECEPGQVLVSEDVWRQLRRRPDFEFSARGERTLKGITEPVPVFAVVLRSSAEDGGARPESPEIKSRPAGRPERADADGRTRLIVLPFRMLRPDPEIDFLAFGLPDAITCSLRGLSALIVRSNVAGLRFASDSPDLRAVAADAGVDVILTGALLRAGDQVRVSAQLSEGEDGTLIWSKTSQVLMRDMFQLQDELTHHIVDSLALPLSAREQQAMARDVPATARAFEFFLRANQLAYQEANWPAARDLYRAALEEDPRYAPAWARLGRCYRLIGKYASSAQEAQENQELAEAAFRRALELNPDLPLAHNLYAQLEVESGRAVEAMVRLLQLASASGGDAEIFAGLVHACRYCGLLEASVAAYQGARRLDTHVFTSVSWTYFLLGDYQRCLDTSHPGDHADSQNLASLALLGRRDEALALLQSHEANEANLVMRSFMAMTRAALQGDRAETLSASHPLLETFTDAEGRYFMARILAYVGETERALSELERTLDMGFWFPASVAGDPWFARVHDDRRFQALLDRSEHYRRGALTAFHDAGGERVLGALDEV